MRHIVHFSTGAGSAEVARRVLAAHPGEHVTLLTADTRREDEDNWRFAREMVADLGDPEWIIVCDGRTPMQVGWDERVVPNDRMAVCSKLLKRKMLRRWLEAECDPADTINYLGYDWTEENRLELARPRWEPWAIACPLAEPPHVDKGQVLDQLRARGIEPPRLYGAGFSHANCGGGCVRGGQVEWRRLLYWKRDRYLEWEGEEEGIREHLGKNVAILKHRSGPLEGQPLTLRDYRVGLEADANLFDSEDYGACGCDP